jgi:TRAP-type mannitol/chloroaromatic compound transport system substrate-binding protein
MKKRILLIPGIFVCLVFFLLILLVTSPTSAQQPAKVIEWRMVCKQVAGSPDYIHLAQHPHGIVSYVKEASGGRFIVKPYAQGELVPLREMFDAARKGMVEAVSAASTYWVGKVPASGFAFGLPYCLDTQLDINAYLHELGAADVLREEYAKHNLHLVDVSYDDHQQYLWSKKPVYKVSDFKGLKIRTTGLMKDVLAKAGASLVDIPGAELYLALERGTIDAASWGPIFAATGTGLHEVTNYVLVPPVSGMITTEVFVNKDAWEALPNDLKAIFELSTIAWNRSISEKFPYMGLKKLKSLIDAGKIKMAVMAPEEEKKMKKISMEVLSEAAKRDPASGKMYQILMDYMKLRGLLD